MGQINMSSLLYFNMKAQFEAGIVFILYSPKAAILFPLPK